MSKQRWIEKGYESAALSGLDSLKIEHLAKLVSISKSSFYHHFADLEVFEQELLNHHLQQAELIAQKEKQAKRIDPELIQILLDHPIDLLFHRQLRFHRNRPAFNLTVEKAEQLIGEELLELWIKDVKISMTKKQLQGIFSLAMENFYLQLLPENITKDWLSGYFSQLRKIASDVA
ncbi:MAG: TetR/AcrR family transcriptional regulator [Algoriphagus sp.]|jgi:AcrR family transcriptional regulator|nr:TetR/AcrR family transcriptional regulator [Algoriphagus sp.]